MKSIMQEASSIAKAIEQGWEKAGKPTDFSVKILEKPQKNFFGMTTHPAKIAMYFDERPAQRHDSFQQRPHKVRETHVAQRELRQPEQQRPANVQRSPEHRIESRPLEPRSEQKVPAQRFEAQWNEAMINYAREWLETVLPQSTGKQVGFSIEPNNFYFRQPLKKIQIYI